MRGYRASSYGDAFADVYDDWFAEVSEVEAAVTALEALAGGGPVLELGIGTGRLALPLAARGVPVHGVDASAAMVARLRDKPGGAAIPVTIGDMAHDLPDGPFTLVFVAYNTFFGLVDPGAQADCFVAVARRLTPGGRFVIEAFVPEEPAPAGRRLEVRSIELDRVVLSVSDHLPAEQVAFGHHVELVDGEPVRLRPWKVRYATPAQLDAMARAAGFEPEARTAGWRGEPFTDASATHVSVYRLGAAIASGPS